MFHDPLRTVRALDVNAERMVIGLATMGLGLALLLGQFGGLVVASRLWPLLLIALGIGKLLTPPVAACDPDRALLGKHGALVRGHRARRGGWLIVGGVWLLLDQLRIVRAGDSWPLLLVVLGLAMVWKATAAREQGQA